MDIQINPVMYEFTICKHKTVIEKLNYYEWAKFLERVNEESTATKLLDKLTRVQNVIIFHFIVRFYLMSLRARPASIVESR